METIIAELKTQLEADLKKCLEEKSAACDRLANAEDNFCRAIEAVRRVKKQLRMLTDGPKSL